MSFLKENNLTAADIEEVLEELMPHPAQIDTDVESEDEASQVTDITKVQCNNFDRIFNDKLKDISDDSDTGSLSGENVFGSDEMEPVLETMPGPLSPGGQTQLPTEEELVLDNGDDVESLLNTPALPPNLPYDSEPGTAQLSGERTHKEKNASKRVKKSNAKRSKKQSNPKNQGNEPNKKWSSQERLTTIPIYSLNDWPVFDLFADCKTPTDYFVKFIEGAVDNIVQQSNLYATEKGKTLNLKPHEFYSFIGINFYMGYNKLPSWRDYWATADDLGVALVRNTMARNRFDMILSNLHLVDNMTIPKDNTDKVFKLRPILNHLNVVFPQFYHGTRELAVDESMILFKGRSSIKQYNPMKPIKRGYKLWCLADQHGYIKSFYVYQGKNETIDEKFREFGLGGRVVLSLTEKEWGKDKIIFFDNYFNSLDLLERLKAEKTLACGTIRCDRKGLPVMKADSKMQRGDCEIKVSDTGISFFKWKDTRSVHLASNYHGTEIIQVDRKDEKGEKKKVSAPAVVKDYNRYMGGVDHADQMRASYGLSRRSKKWWHRIFWGVLDIAFVNSYIIYCRSTEEKKPKLLEFRRDVARGLMSFQQVNPKKNLKRGNNTPPRAAPAKRRSKDVSVPDDVRLSNLGNHWPVFEHGVRGRCEMCALKKVQSRPYSKCHHCKVFLCCNDKKNCFIEFHGLDDLH